MSAPQKISRRRFLRYAAVGAGALLAVGAGVTYYLQSRPQEEFRIEEGAIVACCGENCAACPNYSQESCDGCLATAPDAKLSNYCASECQVRPCCHQKNIENCAYCDDYACDKVQGIWSALLDPRYKKRLDQIRGSL